MGVFVVFYINYQDDKVSSVVDTKDLVEEYYTNAQIEEFRKAGITILTQKDQLSMFEFIKYYSKLLENLKTKDKKIVSDILTCAEGHIGWEDNVKFFAVRDFRSIWRYNNALWELRSVARDDTISHKDINQELLKKIRRLRNFIDREYTEPVTTWGSMSDDEYADFAKRLRRYEEYMCKSCKLQFDILSEWVGLSLF